MSLPDGKSRNPYEFGVKVGIATTLKGTLIVGARAFPGNPYDGHTMNEQVEQAAILMQASGMKPETAYCCNLHIGRSCLFKWLICISTLAPYDAV